ncbi:MAG: beta-ketoacyl synthase N-terminal-like domain-containing protein [Planctomycetaceae bacterium]
MDIQVNSTRRVVFTGVGIVSPIGIGIDSFWDSLAAGRSGVGRVESLPYIGSPDSVAGEVTGFTGSVLRKKYLRQHRKSIKVMCREIERGVAAARQAVRRGGRGGPGDAGAGGARPGQAARAPLHLYSPRGRQPPSGGRWVR